MPWEEEEDVYNVLMSHIQEISEQVHFAGPQKLAGDACRIILIDSAAGISIFRERDLFTRMWRCNKPKLVSGINPGRSLYIDRIGQTVFGHVYYCEKAAANVVSTGELEQQGFEVTKEKDMFIVKGKDGAVYKFTRGEDNLYRTYVSTDRNDPTVYNVMEMTYDTVEDRKKRYDKRQIERAMEARRLQWNLGLVSTATLIKLLKSGKIRNTDLTPTDVKIAEYIYGPCVGNLRGKTTAPVPKVIRTEPMPMPQTPEQTMYADLLFINKIPFLLTVIEPLEYVMVTKLKGKGTSQLLWAVNKQIASYKQYGYVIRVMHADQESSLLSDGFKSKSPVRVEPCEDAVGIIERKIRVVKERARGIINTLPFKICNVLNIWLVRYVVSRLNMIPTSNYEEYISAREKLYGRGIDYNKDLKYGVFDYVEVFAKSDNTMEPRTTPALALMPTGSLDGAWYFYILETGSIITRHKATKLPMPNNWIKHLNELANAKDQENNEDLEVIMGGRYIESDPAEPENQEPEGQIEQPQWLVPNIPDNAGEEHNIHPDEIHHRSLQSSRLSATGCSNVPRSYSLFSNCCCSGLPTIKVLRYQSIRAPPMSTMAKPYSTPKITIVALWHPRELNETADYLSHLATAMNVPSYSGHTTDLGAAGTASSRRADSSKEEHQDSGQEVPGLPAVLPRAQPHSNPADLRERRRLPCCLPASEQRPHGITAGPTLQPTNPVPQ